MQEMFRYGLTALFLLFCTWQDIRTGKISGRLIGIFALAGILLNCIIKSPPEILLRGLLPGLGILLFGRLSGEQIGYGDGFVMLVTGLFLKTGGVVSLFLTGLLLCAVCAAVLFLSGKANGKTAFPFLPFLLAGFVVHVLFMLTMQ